MGHNEKHNHCSAGEYELTRRPEGEILMEHDVLILFYYNETWSNVPCKNKYVSCKVIPEL